MSRSSRNSEKEMVSLIRKAVRAEMERGKEVETERVMERVTERVMERVTERVMERVTERVIKRVVERGMKRALDPLLEPVIERVVERGIKRALEPLLEPVIERGMKRALEPLLEPVIERGMKRALEPVMEPVMERLMKRMRKREMEPATEPVIKRAMEPTFSAPADWNVNPRTSLHHRVTKSAEAELELLFVNKLPDKIFTKDKIKDENGGNVEIKLIDSISRETVKVGPLSSLEIDTEILVLDGDFGFEDHEHWTEQQFNSKIVHQREGKGPLVKGKLKIKLRGGVGTIRDLSFSDNSSWIKCGMFRLGARAGRTLQRSRMGQTRIKEAISEAFAVRDHRMRDYPVKRNKKLDPPSLDDDVCRLKKIKKNGKFHTRLIDNNILTVRDFKRMHRTDLNKLREILKDCTDPDWEIMVQEASCVVDDEKEKHDAASNPLISTATCLLYHKFPVPHQGSTGMQNANNHASPSNKIGFSTAEEIDPNLTSQPLAMSNCYPVNAQGAHNNGIFHPPTSGDSGPVSHLPLRNSSQSNECNFLSSLNDLVEVEPHNNPTTDPLPYEFPITHQGLVRTRNANNHASPSHKVGFSTEEIDPNLTSQPRTKSTGYPVNAQGAHNNGIFHLPTNGDSGSGSHFPLRNSSQSKAYSNPLVSQEAEPYNSPTTGLLLHEFPVIHQGSTGMQNDNNHPLSSHHKGAFPPEIVQDLTPQPPAMSNPLSLVNVQLTLSNDNHQPLNNGDPVWNSSQFNELVLFHSLNTQLMIGSSQNSNGPHSHLSASQNSQNTVMSPGTSLFCKFLNRSLTSNSVT